MADWCYYAVGYNQNGVLEKYEEGLYAEKIEQGWEEEEIEEAYTYSDPLLHVEEENMNLLYPDAKDEDDVIENGHPSITREEGEIIIKKDHPNFIQICELIRTKVWPDEYYFDGSKYEWKEAMELVKTRDIDVICISEIEPPQ